MARPDKDILQKFADVAYKRRFDWEDYRAVLRIFNTSKAIREEIFKYAIRALDAWDDKVQLHDSTGRAVSLPDEIARAVAAEDAGGRRKTLQLDPAPEQGHIANEYDFAELGVWMYRSGLREEEYLALIQYMKTPKPKRDRLTSQLLEEYRKENNLEVRGDQKKSSTRVIPFRGNTEI